MIAPKKSTAPPTVVSGLSPNAGPAAAGFHRALPRGAGRREHPRGVGLDRHARLGRALEPLRHRLQVGGRHHVAPLLHPDLARFETATDLRTAQRILPPPI